jgi:hypothetical protein
MFVKIVVFVIIEDAIILHSNFTFGSNILCVILFLQTFSCYEEKDGRRSAEWHVRYVT